MPRELILGVVLSRVSSPRADFHRCGPARRLNNVPEGPALRVAVFSEHDESNADMTPFELLEPRALREAAALLASDGGVVRPMGGGTALVLMMKMGVLRPTRLVSLRGIEKRYSRISAVKDGGLRIGALATLS